MKDQEAAYQKTFDAWSEGEHAHALELSRELLHDFPDFEIGLLLQGIILYELARYEEAEHLLQIVIQDLSPEHLDHGYVHLGHLYRERGDYENAEQCYRKAIELQCDNAGRHIFLGALLAKKGDLAGAEAAHRHATKCTEGPLDEAYFNLGLVLRAQERYREALECFERALELDPQYKDAIKGKNDLIKTLAYLKTGERD
jgi:tetratricopeptide (TPR) repeat protein